MSDEKVEQDNATAHTQHDEIAHTPDYVPTTHLDLDKQIAEYVGAAAAPIDAALNKKLFWTVNRRILACMLGTYFCQSLDKGTLGFSSIMGIQKDARLVGNEYSWLGTILYLGVLTGEYPTNFLLQKLPVAKYLAAKYVSTISLRLGRLAN
ncbi:allantoate permease protein [Rutstroemia sp. NJR-2017a BBW]|nr:allantoate permease protein [Rutstroemia sp. NJR-2017a BBW]